MASFLVYNKKLEIKKRYYKIYISDNDKCILNIN